MTLQLSYRYFKFIFIFCTTQVTLPTATQECVENCVDILKRCDSSATEFELYGDEIGGCGEPSVNLQKIAVGNMQSNIQDSDSPRSQMSPAYEVYKDFSITELYVADVLSEWADRGQDQSVLYYWH